MFELETAAKLDPAAEILADFLRLGLTKPFLAALGLLLLVQLFILGRWIQFCRCWLNPGRQSIVL
jgi:hypothetical protein